VIVKTEKKYLAKIEEIMELIRTFMRQTYYSAHEMIIDYNQNYEGKALKHIEDPLEINPAELYQFLNDKCQNKISHIQNNLVYAQIKYKSNLLYLFN